MPTCLNDPNLGNHEFAHLEVSHEMLLLSDSLSLGHKSYRSRPTMMKQIARLSFSPVWERQKIKKTKHKKTKQKNPKQHK